MAITHTWSIGSSLQTKQQDEYDNVVFDAVWKLYSYEVTDEGVEYNCITVNSVTFNTENITNFTPYENLTEDQVLTWAKAAIDEQALSGGLTTTCAEWEAGHVRNIAKQMNPPIANQTAPWVDEQIIPVDPNPPE
jgi:hypothetical protein|tara:strand:- start:74 stop:478 length:405 start_codon:yes stop_codon:yes gene_type:complete